MGTPDFTGQVADIFYFFIICQFFNCVEVVQKCKSMRSQWQHWSMLTFHMHAMVKTGEMTLSKRELALKVNQSQGTPERSPHQDELIKSTSWSWMSGNKKNVTETAHAIPKWLGNQKVFKMGPQMGQYSVPIRRGCLDMSKEFWGLLQTNFETFRRKTITQNEILILTPEHTVETCIVFASQEKSSKWHQQVMATDSWDSDRVIMNTSQNYQWGVLC